MNVDINKEVQRAMMSPNQDQGIVNLLASELKARDAKARQQINNLMAGQPDPNSIMAQNEREVENSVRQEIGQKMQARVMQERQAQARQRQALAGIAGQRAPNMRMADGGIVGYDRGGFLSSLKKLDEGLKSDEAARQAERMARGRRVSDYIPVPGGGSYYLPAKNLIYDIGQGVSGLANLFKGESEEEQPAPFDVEGRVIELIKARETANEEAKARIDQELSGFDPATVMSARQRMSQGMQAGGIVGLQEGGMPRFPRLFDFSMFLAEKGIDSLAGLSADAVNRLRQEYQAMQAREMNRPRGDSVSESQMENLGGVLRGAGNVLREGITATMPSPASPPSAGEREATEAQREGRRRGPGAMLEGIASLAPRGKSELQRELEAAERRMQAEQREAGLADAQSEMDILNAAQQRRDEAERAARGPQPYVLSDLAKGAGLDGFFSGIPSFEEMYPPNPEDASLAYKVGSATRALGTPFKVLSGFLQPKDEGQLTFSDIGPIASEFTAGLTGAEMPTQQTDVEVAENIITTAPETTTAAPTEEYDPMKGVPQIANPSLRRAIEGTQEEPAPTQEAVIDTASTVAQSPTPENTSRFESEIQRLMERRESPMRALSDFLTSFSQARGGSMGQNLAIATTGMRAADDALDKQIIELEKLRRADQISERDYQLKKDQVESDRLYRKAMADYYSNIESSRLELQELVNQGKLADARQRLRTELISAGMSNMGVYQMQARAADKNADASTINDRAMTLLQQDITNLINTFITNAGGPQFTEGQTATNAQGEKLVFRNGNWEAM